MAAVENGAIPEASLTVLERLCPGSHFVPFFKGMAALNAGRFLEAANLFAQAEPMQPDQDSLGLTAFYCAYAHTRQEQWKEALLPLTRAIAASPHVKEYHNLRGVVLFKQAEFSEAAEHFTAALALDKGSSTDIANLGICHKRMGNKERAAHFLQAALNLEPGLDYAKKELNDLFS